MALTSLDKKALLERLERIKHEPEADRQEDAARQMNLASVLLELAGVSHESEYALCRNVAEHLLGEVPEPDEIDSDEG